MPTFSHYAACSYQQHPNKSIFVIHSGPLIWKFKVASLMSVMMKGQAGPRVKTYKEGMKGYKRVVSPAWASTE